MTTAERLPAGADDVVVCPDLPELSRRAAQVFVEAAQRAIAAQGRFAVALSGGSTPRTMYSLLGSDFRDRVGWQAVHFFWSDERCVPPDHPDSNYRMAREALLSHIAVPQQNVHRMRGEDPIPTHAAEEYERLMRAFFEAQGGPRFDLVLLGMGPDGHTASLFPGTDAVAESRRLVIPVYVEKLRSSRLTLTLPVLNAAAEVMFLVAGEDKAPMLDRVLRKESDPYPFPAQLVRPTDGRLRWMVDSRAAAQWSLSA